MLECAQRSGHHRICFGYSAAQEEHGCPQIAQLEQEKEKKRRTHGSKLASLPRRRQQYEFQYGAPIRRFSSDMAYEEPWRVFARDG